MYIYKEFSFSMYHAVHIHVELLVDTSISPYCLQCLDGSGVALPDTVWFLPDGRIVTTTSDVEVVNGVLVLLDPMAIIRPG